MTVDVDPTSKISCILSILQAIGSAHHIAVCRHGVVAHQDLLL